MSRDLRVIFIKLADRLHNMRTIEHMSQSARRRISAETLEIYAPIAARLGMSELREELEDLGFRHRYPNRYRRSEEHTSELQSRGQLVCRLLLENKKTRA